MTRLDITQVTAPARVGGSESVVAALARGLAGRGHRVRLVALLGQSLEDRCLAFEGIEAAGVETIDIRCPPRSYALEWRRVAAVLGDGATTAHSHGYHADLVAWRAGRLAGRRLVSTAHGFTGGNLKNRTYEWADRRIIARFDAVVAVSAPLRDRLTADGFAPERVHLVPNAYPGSTGFLSREAARRELGLPLAGRVVGWIGRLTQEKGPDLFVDAMARLPEDIRGSVIGEGSMAESLAERSRAAGVNGRLLWHGMVPGAARVLAAFDVLVLSSRTEGTPMVLLEAMAAGVPVVATAVGGVPDVVSEADAVVVDTVAAGPIADGIRHCLDRPEAARARADCARARVAADYGVEAWLDRHEQLYRSLA